MNDELPSQGLLDTNVLILRKWQSGHASFRLLYVFEFAADGKIKSEGVWVDLAAIQQQLS
jgi:hypothetical protein